MPVPIFVFGSNLAGRHGKGAALFARTSRGAIYGCGVGPQGHSYAIPTKDHDLRPLPVAAIARYVGGFLAHARNHPGLLFELTPIGCGLAGHAPAEIAPLFAAAPANVLLPETFKRFLAVAPASDPPPFVRLEDQPAQQLALVANRLDADAGRDPGGILPPDALAGFFGTHRFLSNFWLAPVGLYDQPYPSVEHAFQAAKAIDPADREAIRRSPTPAAAKRLGREVAIRPDWEALKCAFMFILVRRKFGDPGLARQLLATGAAPLFEDSTRWNDRVWGVVRAGERYVGGNRLGRILEATRSELRALNPALA